MKKMVLVLSTLLALGACVTSGDDAVAEANGDK